MDFSLGMSAFGWGIFSAISLPLGAFLGMWLKPNQKISSASMAFGAGALIFALTIELFSHVPQHVEEHGKAVLWVAIVGAVLGGLLFDGLNSILNNKGAFLRKFSSAKKYVAHLKLKRTKKMIKELSEVEILRVIPPDKMGGLVHSVEQEFFAAGTHIFKQGDDAHKLYFIISGEVKIIRHEDEQVSELATLNAQDTFGEMGLLRGYPRTADAIAGTDVHLYVLAEGAFRLLLDENPKVKQSVYDLAADREKGIKDLASNLHAGKWAAATEKSLENGTLSVTADEIKKEGHGSNAALAIWLGILIDGIPESLVIGMLATSVKGMSLAFVAGVFLANLPEAMSSAVSMRKNGMSLTRVYVMWGSICLLTGVGALIGAYIFPANPEGVMFYVVTGIEALAAGAMLTMIAETMLPEAFEQGGSVVGLSTLCGFLSALLVKILF